MLARGSSQLLLVVPLVFAHACAVDRSGLGTEAPDGRVPPPSDAAVDGGGTEVDAGPDAQIEPTDGCVPGAELCNGLDDDCDPSTPDGADEPTLDDACDDDDADLCADGRVACAEGALACDAEDGDQPDERELCNGLDDDCDPATPDGADEPTLSDACDGGDADLCQEGTVVCAAGGLSCDDATGDAVELCNGLDDDCDPSTADGAGEATFGDACDGSDADRCEEGVVACSGVGLSCDDTTGDAVELCNGMDDDCDPSTPDGADEATLADACDGGDADLCEEGVVVCSGGGLSCDDATPDAVELCNGMDDDCDASTPDGAGDPAVGVSCDGPDADACEEGVSFCTGAGVACGDTTGDSTEICNGLDDDCDGTIDEGAGCPCDPRTYMGHTYLFCDASYFRNFADATRFCGAQGYYLAQIEDAPENAWVATQMASIRSDRDWWIGGTDALIEGLWLWTDGSAVVYDNWETSPAVQPSGNGDCIEVDPGVTVGTTLGGWNDIDCAEGKRFVCEAGP